MANLKENNLTSAAIQEYCERIVNCALEAVDPYRLILDNIKIRDNCLVIKDRTFDLNQFDRLHILGAGKGAPFLFKGLKERLGGRISGGIIVSLKEHEFLDGKVRLYAGTHPIPGQRSLAAGQAMARYIDTHVDRSDLVFFLVTGGASALMILPREGINLEDKIKINELLLACGADINEINCVRKHISGLKGGKLAKRISPARVISLILSDIVDSPLGAVGSGPSIPDSSTFSDARAVLNKYDLMKKLPPKAKIFFKSPPPGIEEKIIPPDTSHDAHFLLGDNRLALEAAKTCAQNMGIPAHILTSRDKGEASETAKIYAAIVKEIIHSQTPFKPPVLLLSGGELTVTLPHKKKIGKGGRNQAFVLYMLKELKEITQPFHILSIGTDGIDGPTDAAGARVHQETMAKVKRLGLDMNEYLENHDSYHFFQALDQLIKTGPTKTNVMDLRMFFIKGSATPPYSRSA
jgi:glycerate-2-kinase